MVFTPMNSPLHTSPRSRRQTTSSPTVPQASMPASSPSQRRIMSPLPDEVNSPIAAESFQTFFGNARRSFSPHTDYGEMIVEDVSEDEYQEDEVEVSLVLGQEKIESALRPTDEGRTEPSWKGWLGAAVVGVISIGVAIVVGKAAKEKPRERHDLKYYLG